MAAIAPAREELTIHNSSKTTIQALGATGGLIWPTEGLSIFAELRRLTVPVVAVNGGLLDVHGRRGPPAHTVEV